MLSKIVKMLFVISLVVGCAPFTRYQQPTDVPLAKLKIYIAPGTTLGLYENGKCKPLKYGTSAAFRGADGTFVEGAEEIMIPVINGLTLTMHTLIIEPHGLAQINHNCDYSISFSPKADGVYELKHTYANDMCAAVLFNTTSGQTQKEPSAKNLAKTCEVY